MRFGVKPIVCEYAVYPIGTKEIVCICNIRANADLIAKILNADQSEEMAYQYEISGKEDD